MATRVGINGFGRIGRQVLKAMRDSYPESLQVVAFNDIGDLPTMAHLLKYDSNYGRFNGKVEVADSALVIDGQPIKAFKETDPGKIPWGDLGVDIVIESTGLFTIKKDGVNKKGKVVQGAENHITRGGAKKVCEITVAAGKLELKGLVLRGVTAKELAVRSGAKAIANQTETSASAATVRTRKSMSLGRGEVLTVLG